MSIETAIVLATLITNVIGFAYTWFREARAHRWAMEELAHNRHTANNNSQALTNKVELGTRAAGDAYKEANDVNLKIQALMREVAILRRQRKRK